MNRIIFLFLITMSLEACSQPKQEWANFSHYAAANKLVRPPLRNENRIVFMGNSITDMWVYTDSAFFAGKPYIGRGISGQVTSQMLVRFRPDVIELKPAVVVVLAGINDIAENNGPIPLEAIFGNIVSMAELAKANGIKVVLSSVLPANKLPWRPDIESADLVIHLNDMISKYCKSSNMIYVDYFSAMVDDRKGLDKKYTNDGVHPTLAGYKIMEPLVEAAIAKALGND